MEAGSRGGGQGAPLRDLGFSGEWGGTPMPHLQPREDCTRSRFLLRRGGPLHQRAAAGGALPGTHAAVHCSAQSSPGYGQRPGSLSPMGERASLAGALCFRRGRQAGPRVHRPVLSRKSLRRRRGDSGGDARERVFHTNRTGTGRPPGIAEARSESPSMPMRRRHKRSYVLASSLLPARMEQLTWRKKPPLPGF